MTFKLGSDQVILRLTFHSKQMRQMTLETQSVTRLSSHVFQLCGEHWEVSFALSGRSSRLAFCWVYFLPPPPKTSPFYCSRTVNAFAKASP